MSSGGGRPAMSYIPEDRQRVGLALGATVAENANAGRDDRAAFSRGPFLNRQAMARFARSLIERYRIRVGGPSARASTMSGGNKQKLVVGRELARATPLVVAENPTWGVDIGAIDFIHGELMRMRDEGHAVLLVSTELDEILALSDRILVMYDGQGRRRGFARRSQPRAHRRTDDLARRGRAERRRMNARMPLRSELASWLGVAASIAVVLLALMALAGAPFGEALSGFVDGAFGGRRFSYLLTTLSRTALIVGMAISVMLSFRAGLFNIGGEGQLVAGGLVAALVAILLPGPPLVVLLAVHRSPPWLPVRSGRCWRASCSSISACRCWSARCCSTIRSATSAPISSRTRSATSSPAWCSRISCRRRCGCPISRARASTSASCSSPRRAFSRSSTATRRCTAITPA